MAHTSAPLQPRHLALIDLENAPKWAGHERLWIDAVSGPSGSAEHEHGDDTWEVFRAFDGELPDKRTIFCAGDRGGFDAIVLTGSHFSVYDPNIGPWLDPLLELIRHCALAPLASHHQSLAGGGTGAAGEDSKAGESGGAAAATNRPSLRRTLVLAGCFGSQVVAAALGGMDSVGKNPDGSFVFPSEAVVPNDAFREAVVRWIGGDESVRDGSSGGEKTMLGWMDEPMRLLESHGDCVLRLPPTAVLLGSSPSCEHEVWTAGFEESVLAFQSHPELFPSDLADKILPAISEKNVIDAAQSRTSETALGSFELERLVERRTEGGDTEGSAPSPPCGASPPSVLLHSNRLIALFRAFLRRSPRAII
jgi:GMP synthase-like glutamine amidotransferase